MADYVPYNNGDHRIPLNSPTEDIDEVISKVQKLLDQIKQYRAFLVKNRQENALNPPGVSAFENDVLKERDHLLRIQSAVSTKYQSTSDGLEPTNVQKSLQSSNLVHYLAVWDTAKSCSGLVGFPRRVYWESPTRVTKQKNKPQTTSAYYDLTVQDGAEWIKVSTITEKRLIRELAEKGFNPEDSPNENEEVDEDDLVDLVKAAHHLQRAAKSTRVRFKHPHVRFVLPKITPGRTAEIDHLLDQIRATGATVDCGQPNEDRAQLPLEELFVQLLPSSSRILTETINVDCTVLLALVSDLSHYDTAQIEREAKALNPSGTLKSFIKSQMEKEVDEQLMQTVLYPLLTDHELVCTEKAAVQMREVVNIIGTDSEKKRTAILMGDLESITDKIYEEYAALSIHPVPTTFNIPIKTVQDEIKLEHLPPVAGKVVDHFQIDNTSECTRSVFMYGWQANITTISSNRAATKAIENVIHEEDSNDGGPDVYLIKTARSLVGKEKRAHSKAKDEE